MRMPSHVQAMPVGSDRGALRNKCNWPSLLPEQSPQHATYRKNDRPNDEEHRAASAMGGWKAAFSKWIVAAILGQIPRKLKVILYRQIAPPLSGRLRDHLTRKPLFFPLAPALRFLHLFRG